MQPPQLTLRILHIRQFTRLVQAVIQSETQKGVPRPKGWERVWRARRAAQADAKTIVMNEEEVAQRVEEHDLF